MNPFKYGSVVSKDDFCPRPALEKSIKKNILSNQNMYIEGERRTGKTSLLFETIRKIKTIRLLYIDILEIKTVDEFCRRIIKALISMESKAGVVQRMLKYLNQLKPTVTIDPITGMPSVSLDTTVELKPESIEGLMELIKSEGKKKKTVAVFDEFQDILNLKEASSTLAILRSKIQFHTTIPYIFVGSIRNKMNEIFTSSDSPFFKSAISVYVGEIAQDRFNKFLINKFNRGERRIEQSFLDNVFIIAQDNPGDIQQLCAALWDTTAKGQLISQDALADALELIFSHEVKGYEAYLNQVSSQQIRCLSALAREGGKAPFSDGFLKSTGISQPGSIKKALNRLMQLRIIYKSDNEYKFVNPYFKEWLIYKDL